MIYRLYRLLRIVAALFKSYLPTLLLSLMYVVGELATLVNWPNRIENWILTVHVPMRVDWNVKYASGQIQWIIAAVMFLYYVKTPNKVNRTSMTVFLLWTIFDTFCYFYNYKTFGYVAMYLWLPLTWVIFYFWSSKHTERLWKLTKPG